MMIKKRVFEECGLFDTELGRRGTTLLGSEEKAFFDKVQKHGFRLMYWPDMMLYHRIGSSRLEKSYIKSQSIGIGRSERIRVQSSVASTTLKLLSEAIKFCGSFVLGLGYLIKGKWSAAALLIQFRIWVLAGFLQKDHDPV